MANEQSDSTDRIVHPIPHLGDLKEIPVPVEYRGHPQRIQDFLTGFQMAWEIAQSIQSGEM